MAIVETHRVISATDPRILLFLQFDLAVLGQINFVLLVVRNIRSLCGLKPNRGFSELAHGGSRGCLAPYHISR